MVCTMYTCIVHAHPHGLFRHEAFRVYISKGEEEEEANISHHHVYMYITAAGIVFGTNILKSMSSFKVQVAKCTALT